MQQSWGTNPFNVSTCIATYLFIYNYEVFIVATYIHRCRKHGTMD